MGIDTTVLPDSNPVIAMAYEVARAIVNPALATVCAPFPPPASPLVSIYALAVYNLAGDNLLNYAQDQPGAKPVAGSDPPAPYFQNLRKVWNMTGFVSGIVQASSDEGTSVTLVVMDAAKNFTLGNLQNLKTPYGRQYLAFAQDYGPGPWGID